MEIILADLGTQFTSIEFQGECKTIGVWLTLADPEHQEMNIQVKVTQRTLCTIAHSLMVHAQVLEAYILFALMYTADHISPVLPIKDSINEFRETTTPFKLATGKNFSITFMCFILSMCCTKSYYTCWDIGVKHDSRSAKVFLQYLIQNYTASKRVSCLCTTQTVDRIFIQYCF